MRLISIEQNFMQLTVREVANLLNTSDKSVYRWISDGDLPAYRVSGQYRFNRAELIEWATARRINVSPKLFQETEREQLPLPDLAETLQAGGIFYRVGGKDKAAVLRNLVDLLRLPDVVDREFLFQVLWAREVLESTAFGEGIAIPHVRNPIVLHINKPMVTLCFLEHPVDFGALDGQPVSALFSLISPTVRAHLHLLSRLAFFLRDVQFKRLVQNQAGREEILEAVRRLCSDLKRTSSIIPISGTA